MKAMICLALTQLARKFGLIFAALLCIALSACANPIQQDIKVQFVHAQTLKPLEGIFASVQWMEEKTGVCKRHSVLRSDAQGRVHFKKVPGAYARPMNAMGLDLQTINRRYHPETNRPMHLIIGNRNAEAPLNAWERMIISLGYEEIVSEGYASVDFVLWLPVDENPSKDGYTRSYMLSARQEPFSASQYYTRIGGPCIYRQYDEKTGKNIESVDQSEYTEETRLALDRTKALAQYQLLCDPRWEGVFMAYRESQFYEVLNMVEKMEDWSIAWGKFKKVVPTYDGIQPNYRPFSPVERVQFCNWVAKEIENAPAK
jgi:hypothetical protein